MLTNTFCHIPRIGPVTERKIWDQGVHTWDAALNTSARPAPQLKARCLHFLEQSRERLDNGDADWFAGHLAASETWRLASHFADKAAFVDIETTSGPGPVRITTIALFDGHALRTYVQGRNLESFCDDIRKYPLVVTFNGRCFDGPVIQRELGVALPAAHIDLRFVLASVGLRGGLKACEKQLGLDREELDGVDGYFAVLLWQEYQDTGDERVLDTLLAYNAADVLSMPLLLTHAYQAKLRAMPFCSPALPDPKALPNPHQADLDVITRIRARFSLRFLRGMG
jgi:uncharacterized protein